VKTRAFRNVGWDKLAERATAHHCHAIGNLKRWGRTSASSVESRRRAGLVPPYGQPRRPPKKIVNGVAWQAITSLLPLLLRGGEDGNGRNESMSSHNWERRGTVQGVHRTIVWLLASGAWAAGLWGALQLQRLPTSRVGRTCPVWSRGAAGLRCRRCWRATDFGCCCLAHRPFSPHCGSEPLGWSWECCWSLSGRAGLLGVAAYEAATWFRGASEWQRQYAAQRYFLRAWSRCRLPHPRGSDRGSGLWWAYRAKSIRRRHRSPSCPMGLIASSCRPFLRIWIPSERPGSVSTASLSTPAADMGTT